MVIKPSNSAELYCGPLSVTSCNGMPCSAKMLFKLLMTADDVVLVSLLMMGNLLYWSVSRRYCWPLNWNISELSLSHGRHGGCGWSIGSFGAFLWYFWQGLHWSTLLMISFVIPGQNTRVRARSRHFSCPKWPWCMMSRTSGLKVGGIKIRSPFSSRPSSTVNSSLKFQ